MYMYSLFSTCGCGPNIRRNTNNARVLISQAALDDLHTFDRRGELERNGLSVLIDSNTITIHCIVWRATTEYYEIITVCIIREKVHHYYIHVHVLYVWMVWALWSNCVCMCICDMYLNGNMINGVKETDTKKQPDREGENNSNMSLPPTRLIISEYTYSGQMSDFKGWSFVSSIA